MGFLDKVLLIMGFVLDLIVVFCLIVKGGKFVKMFLCVVLLNLL